MDALPEDRAESAAGGKNYKIEFHLTFKNDETGKFCTSFIKTTHEEIKLK